MNERLLQFIWQHQYFNKNELCTTAGEELRILHPGIYNNHQGPDFTQARVQIGSLVFAGHIELHIRTSDWQRHRHDDDDNYRNVILHVVWNHDLQGLQPIAVLVLENRVSNLLLDQYSLLMQQPHFIACNKMAAKVGALTWQQWGKQLIVERLIQRSAAIAEYLAENHQHWEESFWWWLARNFGAKVNASAFESMAKTIPVLTLARHKSQLHQLEALLFGQAGLLNRKFEEDYPKMLQKEYRYLQKKYGLSPSAYPLYFLRMRPVNFPSVRIAQLAALIHQSAQLFSVIRDTPMVTDVKNLFDVTANDYWHYHYLFDEASAYKPKHIGSQMIDSLIINAVCPALFAYGHINNEQEHRDKALRWLSETAAEKNVIISAFNQIGIFPANASDSQALLEMKSNYCDQKKCLDCDIGNAILKNATR